MHGHTHLWAAVHIHRSDCRVVTVVEWCNPLIGHLLKASSLCCLCTLPQTSSALEARPTPEGSSQHKGGKCQFF